jgi:hypothetical protein
VGETIESHEPQQLAKKIEAMVANKDKLAFYRQNCRIAAQTLNWENEQKKLIEVLQKYV